ncbi:hypothetical protein AB0A66_00040 [Streptomyces longwoodensis]|uniref:hypothetical protein n=1 Tax=Streptomyces longwoodensis TaxID=68231 RepID=UPI0033E90DD7
MEVNRWADVWIGGAATTTTAAERSYDASAAVGETRRGLRGRPWQASAGRTDPADMVVRAALTARRRSGAPDGGVDLVLHATAGGPGAVAGTAAAVLRGLGCPAATAWEVCRPVAGGVLALHLAAQYVSGRPETPLIALVTAVDGASTCPDGRPEQPGGGSTGEAAGLVLTTAAGGARLLSTVVLGDPPYGALLRTDLPWQVPAHRNAPGTPGKRGSWAWVRGRGRRPATECAAPVHGTPSRPIAVPEHAIGLGGREGEAVRLALAECERTVDDVGCYVLAPGDGGARTSGGHVAALARLLEEDRPRYGGTVVLVGGDGHGVGCAVLEITGTG